jgi:hypothetical protein
MRQHNPLRWRRHLITTVPSEDVAVLLDQLAPANALARSMQAVPVEADTIDLPELPASPVAKAATLLRVAAQVEHALMVQYLYAGYSFRSTEKTITGVAVEEMSHLMTVQNLLRCIGEEPHLDRQDDSAAIGEDHRLFPFDFRLEPLSHVSLAKYVVAESPATAPEGVDPAVLAHIVDLAIGAQPEPVDRVGTLYALLSVVFGTPELLLELAEEEQSDWYRVVSQLAVEAAEFYGGPASLHLPDSAFQFASAQASDDDWDRSKITTIDEFRVHDVASRREVLEALRDIGLQGEGPSTEAGETAHFRRFYDLFVKFFGADGHGTTPPPGVLNVPAGADIVVDPGGTAGEGIISHPNTAQWARLGDLRYALLLGALQRYLLASAQERTFLRGWCFAEMYAVRKLAELLRAMPAGTAASAAVAALPFNPPVWPGAGAQWSDLAAAFEESRTIATNLVGGVPDGPDGGHRLLVHLLASDERKLAESRARATGQTRRTRTDAVRDTLDWAAGAGDPGHSKNGRFWNLQNAELVEVEMFGSVITEPEAPGEDALLVSQLRQPGGDMPRLRPKLEQTSPEFRLVESWVADGCPDDPVESSPLREEDT